MRDDLDLDHFEDLLVKRRTDLEEGLDSLRKDCAPVELDQSKVGRLSRMDSMQQQAMAQESLRRAQQELSRIQSALGRLRSGDYGDCVKCEEEIGERRLLALPDTLICIDCANGSRN